MVLYGDLITAITDAVIFPVYFRSRSQPVPDAAESAVLSLLLCCCCLHWIAWIKNSRATSILVFVLKMANVVVAVVARWPHGPDTPVAPQFLWMIFIHLSGNYEHKTTSKIAMLVFTFLCSIPCAVLTDDVDIVWTLSICFSATAVAIGLHACVLPCNVNWKDELLSARLAALLLAVVYAHQLATEIVRMAHEPGYLQTGTCNVLKMGFSASLGYLATGVFQSQVSTRQALHRLVAMKGDELARQAEIMQMTSMALEASENAIAITDAGHGIIWSNLAFQKLMDLSPHTATGSCLIHAMQLTGESRSAFVSCFDTCQRHLELSIKGRYTRITFIPFVISRRACGEQEQRYLRHHTSQGSRAC